MKIGYFVTPLITKSPRGTASVARKFISEISTRDDIEFYAIYKRHNLGDDYLGNYYSTKSIKGVKIDDISEISGKYLNIDPLSIYREPSGEPNLNWKFTLPLKVILKLSESLSRKPVDFLDSQLRRFKFLAPFMPTIFIEFAKDLKAKLLAGELGLARRPLEEDELNISDIGSFDLILNFWWFHSDYPNPLMELDNPENLNVLSWIYDLIPLRVENVAASGIDPRVFAAKVREHVDRSTHLVCISEQVQSDLQHYIKNDVDSKVLPCGINLAEFMELHPKCSKRPRSILIIGSIEPTKNFTRAVKALEIVIRNGGVVSSLDIVGPYRSDIKEKIEPILALGVNVLIHDSITDNQKIALLSECDLLLYPSISEGFGIPVLEAIASLTKVICGNVGIPEIVTSNQVSCVDPFSIDEISTEIIRLLDSPQVLSLGNAEKDLLEKYDWRNITQQLLSDDWLNRE